MKNSLLSINSFHHSGNFDAAQIFLMFLGPNLTKLCLSHEKDVDVILKVIKSRRSTMKEICFENCMITDGLLRYISLIKELNLLSINLCSCSGFTYFGLREFLKSQRNITKLDLQVDEEPLSDDILQAICENLSKIRDLRLRIFDGSFTEVS